MSTIGRNDPCPCGSGKKYKKCCLEKDQQEQREQRQRQRSTIAHQDETDDLFEDLPTPAIEDDDEDVGMTAAQSARLARDDEPFVCKTISDDVPELSDQNKALVDAWWSAYKEMKDTDEILLHLNGFFEAHPDLVVNLQLHYEVLFELGADLVRAGRAGEYIALLQRVRKAFPNAYLKSFGYYDRDIIYYKIIHQDPAGIDDYLNWFKEYPDTAPDNLFALIKFMMLTECDGPVSDLIETVYYPVHRSEHVIGGGGDLVTSLIVSYCAPYLDNGWTPTDLESLSERMKTIRLPLRSKWYIPASLDRLLGEIVGDLDAAFFASFHDRQSFGRYYQTVTQNFMGWLRREQGFSWMKAEFHRAKLLDYLLRIIPDGKRPKKPFTFTKKLLERSIGGTPFILFAPKPTETFGVLSGIYWFSEYLLQHGLLDDRERVNIQGWCEDLWHPMMERYRKSSIEAGAFETFPG
jgi:tetratricopeptide (TPR) repeat protein